MDSLLRTNCPSCGEVEVTLSRVVLRVAAHMSDACCVLRCPGCSVRLTKTADATMAVVLLAAGVEASVWSSTDPSDARPALTPLTADEIEQFVSGLQQDDAEWSSEWSS